MAAASGQYGKVLADGSSLQECTEWTLTKEHADHAYASCETSGWRNRVAGTKDSSGTCGGIFDPNDPIHDYIVIGDSVTLELYYSSLQYYEVPALIRQIDTDCNIEDGDIIRWTMNWGGNGEVLRYTAVELEGGGGLELEGSSGMLVMAV